MFVSVVIPARNDAEMLARCLTALAAQTRPADEIVVVDNGSTDDTRAVADAAGARVVWEPIAGIPRASSAGFDAARGDVLARIDADTVCPPEWLERIVAAFERDRDLALLTGAGEFYDAGPITRRLGRAWWVGGLYWSMTLYLGHPPVFGSNFAMRRDVWAQIGPDVHREALDIHDDLDLSLHVRPGMTVRYDPDLVVGISARPFSSWAGFARRLSWIVPTLRAHWPEDSPWARRAARRRAAEGAVSPPSR
jgi:glycosyltransferase involved in cell wall biosynthesis